MAHQLGIHDITYAKDIESANFPEIRQFFIPTLPNLEAEQKDISIGNWQQAIGENTRQFSAVAYFFARKLYTKYHVPIGIINASVGGSPLEAWLSEEGLKDFASLLKTSLRNKDTAYINSRNQTFAASNKQAPTHVDAGLAENIKWFDTPYLPKQWHNINIPGYWQDQGIKNLNGVVWYRREIEIPAIMVGKPAKVFLGRIVDADELFINGISVGKTTYQYPQRRYKIASGILKTGKNIFVIRVTNTNGKGGFVPDKPYAIFAGTDSIDLKGTWQYKVGEVYRPNENTNTIQPLAAQNQPSALFNGMVAPEINYAIKGICWYQGESNAEQPQQYAALSSALIKDWRNKFKIDSLPFLYVQLPGFMDYNYLPSESNWALLREAQLKTLSTFNTAMAVAIDLGEWNDIHPDNKKDVGERLALAAQKIAFGEQIIYSGPTYNSYNINADTIEISFTNIGSGLKTMDGAMPAEFAIAGADKKFIWAKTKIGGDKILAWNKEIAEPKFVRYSWSDNPVNPNLYNKEGLPASPFRTDK